MVHSEKDCKIKVACHSTNERQATFLYPLTRISNDLLFSMKNCKIMIIALPMKKKAVSLHIIIKVSNQNYFNNVQVSDFHYLLNRQKQNYT